MVIGSRASSHAAVPSFPSPIEQPPPLRVVLTTIASVGFAVGGGGNVGVSWTTSHCSRFGSQTNGDSQSLFLPHGPPSADNGQQVPS